MPPHLRRKIDWRLRAAAERPIGVRMRILHAAFAVFLVAAPGVAIAGEGGTVTRLSAADAEAAKEAAAKRNIARAAQPEARSADAVKDRAPFFGPVHGEVGFGIGTGGYRGVYGAAAMPIGEDGGVAFAFDSVQFDQNRRRVRR